MTLSAYTMVNGHVGRRLTPQVSCRKCGGEIIYNGNYFCSNWGECDWVLSHHARTGEPLKRDREVWQQIQTALKGGVER